MSNQIYLFYGDEDLLLQNKVRQLSAGASNVEQIDANASSLEVIVSALQTQQLFCNDKLLIINDLDLKTNIWDELAPVLQAVPVGITVILCASFLSKRSKIYKLVEKIGEVCEFKSFAPWEQDQVVSWIVRQAKSLGKEIDRVAAITMQDICGSNLRKLGSEIDKLITYVGERKTISQEDVGKLASPGEISVFALSDAVANKELKNALAAFRLLYRNQVAYFQVLSLLANQFRIMLLLKSEKNTIKIAQVLGTKPYFVNKCQRSAARYSEAELRRNLELLLEADLKLKSGEQQLSTFEILLTSLCAE